ncbi:vacuolar amino acid permease [Leucosporidium creatinivorum]|uniref:Vacuolar amino acid permease n=1 Tax=Leucosporidium creatinivorum TaxID=106004 RepID=A0A1Y2G639_9BASI|nr:vacuolar amino acid permease [Leucosporidium creatinivorum]
MASERTLLLPPTSALGGLEGQRAKDEEEVAALDLPFSTKAVILAGTFFAVFVSAIDVTVVAPLVQPIAASFHASHESSWLGTSFLLANITFTPLYGRLADIVGRRTASASAVALFTLGTLLCAVAPSMRWFMLARFVAGAGGGGISTTSSIIVCDLFHLKQRGLVGSVSNSIWALGAALGGPLGGFVTDAFGWRAAFGLQVPLLAIALVSGLSNINYPVVGARHGESTRDKLRRIDFAGCGLILLSFGNFLVSLSLRNNERLPWMNPWLIASTALAPIFLIAFILVEANYALEPILPLKILTRRTPLFVLFVTVFVAVCNFGIAYHLPIFFLAVEGTTAGEAGAHLLPTSIANIVGGFAAGWVLHSTGKYYTTSAIAGFIAVVGVLLTSQLDPSSSEYLKWLSVVPMGFGFVYILNSSFIALLASVENTDIPAVTGALWLFRTAGQVVGVASTSAIMQGVLASALSARITGKGSKKIIKHILEDSSQIPRLSPELQVAAREGYLVALRAVFWFCALFAFLAWLSMLAIPPLPVEDAEIVEPTEEEPEWEASDSAFLL